MPLYDWSTKEAFDAAYDFSGEPDGHPAGRPEMRLHYNRSARWGYAGEVAAGLTRVLGWGQATRVVVVGCGFGWTVENLVPLVGSVAGTDTSAYVQARKTLPEDDEIAQEVRKAGLDPTTGRGAELMQRHALGQRSKAPDKVLSEDARSAASRGRIRQALGAGPNASFEVLTESVLESLTDAECQQLSSILHQLTNGRVSHYVFTRTPEVTVQLNWKTLEEWKTLLPGDTFVEAGTYRLA